MKFCLEVWGTNYETIKETCRFAEKSGYDGFFYGESLTDIDGLLDGIIVINKYYK